MSPPTRDTGAGSRIGSKTGGIITDKILIPELPAIPAAVKAMIVDTLGGRIQVSWDSGSAATPFGQLVFFAD